MEQLLEVPEVLVEDLVLILDKQEDKELRGKDLPDLILQLFKVEVEAVLEV